VLFKWLAQLKVIVDFSVSYHGEADGVAGEMKTAARNSVSNRELELLSAAELESFMNSIANTTAVVIKPAFEDAAEYNVVCHFTGMTQYHRFTRGARPHVVVMERLTHCGDFAYAAISLYDELPPGVGSRCSLCLYAGHNKATCMKILNLTEADEAVALEQARIAGRDNPSQIVSNEHPAVARARQNGRDEKANASKRVRDNQRVTLRRARRPFVL